MGKYGHTFVLNNDTGEGTIKIMHPTEENILKFHLSKNPKFSTVAEFDELILKNMPAAKQEQMTDEIKQDIVDTEVSVAAIHENLIEVFATSPEKLSEFVDLVGDNPNTGFSQFCVKYGYL